MNSSLCRHGSKIYPHPTHSQMSWNSQETLGLPRNVKLVSRRHSCSQGREAGVGRGRAGRSGPYERCRPPSSPTAAAALVARQLAAHLRHAFELPGEGIEVPVVVEVHDR